MKKHHILAIVQWILLLVLMIFLFLKTGILSLLWAALLLLLLPAISWLWNLAALRSVRVSIDLEQGARKGGQVLGSVAVNTGTMPFLGQVWYVLEGVNELTGERITLQKRVGTEPFQVPVPHCGRFSVQLKGLRVMDFFGILWKNVTLTGQKRTTILPETFAMNIDTKLLLSPADDSDLYETARRGNDPTETFQLREYVEGDPVRSIHWKLSSKIDKLIIREPSQPVDRSLLVYWDQEAGSPAVLDTLAEAVFSLCQALSEAGCVYSLGFMEEGSLRLMEITNIDELLEKLPLLLRRKTGSVTQKPDFNAFGKTLYFTGGITENAFSEGMKVFLCTEKDETREGIVTFTPENYKEKLDFSYEL